MSTHTEKPRIWRTRDGRGHVSPELTTWHYSVPLPGRTVIGRADTWTVALAQVAHRLRRARVERRTVDVVHETIRWTRES